MKEVINGGDQVRLEVYIDADHITAGNLAAYGNCLGEAVVTVSKSTG